MAAEVSELVVGLFGDRPRRQRLGLGQEGAQIIQQGVGRAGGGGGAG